MYSFCSFASGEFDGGDKVAKDTAVVNGTDIRSMVIKTLQVW